MLFLWIVARIFLKPCGITSDGVGKLAVSSGILVKASAPGITLEKPLLPVGQSGRRSDFAFCICPGLVEKSLCNITRIISPLCIRMFHMEHSITS